MLAPARHLRYDSPMKYMLMLMLVLGLALPGAAGQREESLLRGLFGLGAQALEAQSSTAASAHEASAPQNAAPAAASSPSMTQMFIAPIRQSVDGLINEYKEEYKEEGRAYARELGEIVVERVRKDPEITSTITSIRMLCWFVVGYLTLVTLIMLACLVYLKHAHARLLEEVRSMR